MKPKSFYLCLLLLLMGLSAQKCSTEQPTPYSLLDSDTLHYQKADQRDSVQTLTLAFVGDLMCHTPQFKYAQTDSGGYDFLPAFSQVQPYLESADLTFGNLETVLAGNTAPAYSSYPIFNSPNEYADALKSIGFDVVVTANNHSYDKLEAGLIRTLAELQRRGLQTVGTHYTPQGKDTFCIVEKKGFKIGILAYTEFSNIPLKEEKKYLLNHIDTSTLALDIEKIKKAGAEVVIAHFHWGYEYQTQPNSFQRAVTQKAFEAGADIVIGGHPHVLQPIEKVKSASKATLDSGLVAYSLGNFFSGQHKRFRHTGAILNITLEKNNLQKKIRLKSYDFQPTFVFQGFIEGKRQYRILPTFAAPLVASNQQPDLSKANFSKIDSLFPYLNTHDKKQFFESFQDATQILKQQ
ncbi:CapA family protein [Hugenholtzia roseola]|uniref:CapA family protein n=1 Tax=Hugenholtzia roseola TaxID=1002 RepID=UPI00040F7110|nr:CapA family protein [Hugenholtzia roseola]